MKIQYAVFEDVVHLATCPHAEDATALYDTLRALFHDDTELIAMYDENGSSLTSCDDCNPLR